MTEKIKLNVQQAIPLWRLLQMTPDHLMYEVERLARELGYTAMQAPAVSYDQPTVVLTFRVEQIITLDEARG